MRPLEYNTKQYHARSQRTENTDMGGCSLYPGIVTSSPAYRGIYKSSLFFDILSGDLAGYDRWANTIVEHGWLG